MNAIPPLPTTQSEIPVYIILLLDSDAHGAKLISPAALFASLPGGTSAFQRTLAWARELDGELRYVADDRASRKHAEQAGLKRIEQSEIGDSPALLVSPAWPLIQASDAQALIEHATRTSAKRIACVVEQRHHPISSFVASKGTMDFSATLNSAGWRELDERSFFQLVPGMAVLPASAFAKGDCLSDPFDAVAELDEASALHIGHVEPRQVIQSLIEREHSERALKRKRLTWQTP